MGCLGNGLQVGYLELRIGDDLQKHGAGVLVDGGGNGVQTGEVAESWLYAETLERGGEKG